MVALLRSCIYNGSMLGGVPMNEKTSSSTKYLAGYTLACVTAAIHAAALLLSTRISFFPGADVLRTLVPTCAQIIAGLYGITAASFTFFLSRIDGLCAQDPTLDCIAGSLKNRYKYLMWFLTGNVLATLLVSILLLYLPVPTDTDHAFYYRFFCNEFLISLGCSILYNLYYSISVVNPKAIEKEARKLKRRISRSLVPSGDVSRFLVLYDAVERRCCDLLDPVVLDHIYHNRGKHFEPVIELLLLQKKLPAPLLLDIRRLYRYYACTVNCSPMTGTREMVELAQKVSDTLP